MICNTRSPKRYKLAAPNQEEPVEGNDNNDLKGDPFEGLPDDILRHIMSFLPSIKYIAQLSILSPRWQHLWLTYPHLDFFGVEPSASVQQHQEADSYTKSIIQSCFSCRPLSGRYPIQDPAALKIYTFYLRGVFSRRELRKCIWYSFLYSVKDLKLQVSFVGDCTLPEKLFTSKALQSLELRINQKLSPSDYADGWFIFPPLYMKASLDKKLVPDLRSQLRTLCLDQVIFPSSIASEMGLSPYIDFFNESLFPYLTRLSLVKCEGVDVLEVKCPNLIHLEVKKTEMEKLILQTPQLLTLRLLGCFTTEAEGVTSVHLCAPKLLVFQWKYNLVPYSFNISDPMHVKYPEVSFLSLDFDQARGESATNIVSLVCMITTLSIGDSFLMLLEKLDFYEHTVHTRLHMSRLLDLNMFTGMTKKSILGLWFLLQMSHALRSLYVYIAEGFNDEDDSNWGREMLDNGNTSELGFWQMQIDYGVPILKNLEKAKIVIRKGGEIGDVGFVCFLLQKCVGLKYLQVCIHLTPANGPFISDLHALFGSFQCASPDVSILIDAY